MSKHSNNINESDFDQMADIVLFGALTSIFEKYGIKIFAINAATTLCPISIYNTIEKNYSYSYGYNRDSYSDIYFPMSSIPTSDVIANINNIELTNLGGTTPIDTPQLPRRLKTGDIRKTPPIRYPNYTLKSVDGLYHAGKRSKRSEAYGHFCFSGGLKDTTGVYSLNEATGIWQRLNEQEANPTYREPFDIACKLAKIATEFSIMNPSTPAVTRNFYRSKDFEVSLLVQVMRYIEKHKKLRANTTQIDYPGIDDVMNYFSSIVKTQMLPAKASYIGTVTAQQLMARVLVKSGDKNYCAMAEGHIDRFLDQIKVE